MAIIKTSKGIEILVDDDKFEDLNQFTWHINPNGCACRYERVKYMEDKEVYMQRQITNCPKDSVVIHINRTRLDNRLENLKVMSQDEIMQKVREDQ